MNRVTENFLRYVAYDTIADSESTTSPSNKDQLLLAKQLVKECEELGLTEISLDENGYVMATLEANTKKPIPVIGFIAHMDTSPDFSGANIKPLLTKNYDGSTIILNEQENIHLSPEEFPSLNNYIGDTIISTDGTTLLGADDKAGIAEIMTAMHYLITHPEIEHGKIRIGFTPDEEIGRGASHFDVAKFGAKFAYTMDGGPIGELEYENFNAAQGKLIIHGKNIHPGTAKNAMKNAILIGHELINMLPENETPATTEGYEGFFHVNNFNGNVESATMLIIIRDFFMDSFQARKELLQNAVLELNNKYGQQTIELELSDQYFNMVDQIKSHQYVVDIAKTAMKKANITPVIQPIRGGTDGATLSFMGLPCPNIFAGGHNFHGKFEYVPVSSMEKAVDFIISLIETSVDYPF